MLGIGDINDDGLDDVAISAKHDESNGIRAGAVYVFLAPFSGTMELTAADIVIQGSQAFDRAGITFNLIGDINGQGRADLVIGSSPESNALGVSNSIYLLEDFLLFSSGQLPGE